MDISPVDLAAPDRPALDVFYDRGRLRGADTRAWDRGPMVVRTHAGDWVQATVLRVWLVPRGDDTDTVLELEHDLRASTATCMYLAPDTDENLQRIDPAWHPLRDGWLRRLPPRPRPAPGDTQDELRAVVHVPAEPGDGRQLCTRCGIDLRPAASRRTVRDPQPPDTPWPAGSRVAICDAFAYPVRHGDLTEYERPCA